MTLCLGDSDKEAEINFGHLDSLVSGRGGGGGGVGVAGGDGSGHEDCACDGTSGEEFEDGNVTEGCNGVRDIIGEWSSNVCDKERGEERMGLWGYCWEIWEDSNGEDKNGGGGGVGTEDSIHATSAPRSGP